MGDRRFALFLGCTTPARALNYEMSSRAVARHLDIEFVDFDSFTCCGYPTEALNRSTQMLISARNLAVAEREGMDMTVLCSTCGTTLGHTIKHLKAHPEARATINEQLKAFDLEYKGKTTVRHFTRVIYEDIGAKKVASLVTTPLDGLSFGADYGCHYLKPESVFDGFDDPAHPHTLDDLINATGAVSLDFQQRMSCCGAAVLAIDEPTAVRLSGSKLEKIHNVKADGMITQCQFCGIMYDEYQQFIGKQRGIDFDLPVLYLPQLLGWAFGLDLKEQLGFKLNAVKTTKLTEKIAQIHKSGVVPPLLPQQTPV